MSDHLPILLWCSSRLDEKGVRKKWFMFENMCFTGQSYKDIVASSWTLVLTSNVVESLLTHIDKCSAKLSHWNQVTFGNVGQRIKVLEQHLWCQQNAISRCTTLGLIREWQKKEEILWWQWARYDYLKFVDSNTVWFHTRANMRRLRNKIMGLKDVGDA